MGVTRAGMIARGLKAVLAVERKLYRDLPAGTIAKYRKYTVDPIFRARHAWPPGDTPDTILARYSWLEPEDIQACLAYAHKLVAHERVEPLVTSGS